MTPSTTPPTTNPQTAPDEMTRRHLTMQELADREGVALQTVRAWRVTGYGPRGFRVGKFVRYRLTDVLAWEEQQLDPRMANAA